MKKKRRGSYPKNNFKAAPWYIVKHKDGSASYKQRKPKKR